MDQQRTNSSPGCSDVSKSCWSQEEVQALVTLWANPSVQEQLLLNLRNEKVFAGLSTRLASLGFNKAANRCREKIKKLKVEYKKIKDRNYRRGTNNDYGGVWFAIMDGVLNYQPGAAAHSETMEPSSTEPTLPTHPQSFFNVEAGGKPQSIWSADEVQALVKLWADRSVQEQLQSTLRNNKIFTRLSSELASLGFYKAPNRCREKIKKLKQEYKRIKSLGGPNRRERRWFVIMDSVLDPQFAGEAPVDSSSASRLMDSAQPSSPCLGFDKSEKSPCWSPTEVQDVLGYQPGTLGLEPVNSAESTMNDSHLVPNYNAGAGRERISWSPEEVEDLVMLWADNSVQEQLLSTYRNEKIFTSLSSRLMLMGYNKTGSQCRAKIKKLKQEYKRIKDTGALSHQHSKWFIIMDDILSHQQDTLPSEEVDSAQTLLRSTLPSWSVKVENSDVSQSGLFPDEGPSVSHDPSGCEVKTCAAALEPTLQDVPLEDRNHCVWLPDEVQVLLTLWAEPNVQEQLLSTVRNNRVFTYLSNQLASVGFNKTPHQCRIKVKKLKQGYKKIKCVKGSKHIQSRWFAIMDSVLDPGGENVENETNDSKEADSPAALMHPGSPEDEHTNDKLRTIWTPDEVQVLLAWWAEGRVQEQLTSTVRNEKVFAQLSSELTALGFDKTPNQCRFKIKKLKQEYKRVKEQKDSKHRQSRWFAVMDNVLGHQGQETEAEEAAGVMDSAPASLETSQHGFPEKVEDLGECY
uniref:uncharacterized protein n=1 Tax=Centroberyx gerrardi TaxID=166262 RepID=UPI003AAD366F